MSLEHSLSGTVPAGSTDGWTDRKRYLWLIGLVVPSLAFLGVGLQRLKLANAMIGEHGEVKLLDFSLAKLEVLVPSLPIRSAAPGHRIFAHDDTLALHSLPLKRPGSEAPPPAMTRDFGSGWDSPSGEVPRPSRPSGPPPSVPYRTATSE